jgi:hypothetical protein
MPKSRQQLRAKSRSPVQQRRRGARTFLAVMLLVLLGGGALIAVFRANPPPLTRGASIGEHWHTSYKIFICGKRVSNYPTVEGEIHSHSDGFMHVHPSTPAGSGENANVRAFLLLYETALVADAKGQNSLTFPDGTKYTDGDKCKNDGKRYDLTMKNKGKKVTGDLGAFLMHNGDELTIAFGPEGKKTMKNPYSKAKGIEDVGQGSGTPAPG